MMNLGPIEWIIVSVLCLGPVVLALVALGTFWYFRRRR
jgi:hypothetical protein